MSVKYLIARLIVRIGAFDQTTTTNRLEKHSGERWSRSAVTATSLSDSSSR
jgi:hypothetical protein